MPIGGTDKLPSDFTKASKFVGDDQVLASKVAARARTCKHPLPFWERDSVVDALQDVATGAAMTMARDELVTLRKHRCEMWPSGLPWLAQEELVMSRKHRCGHCVAAMTMARDKPVTLRKHRDKYVAAMRERRTAQMKAQISKQVEHPTSPGHSAENKHRKRIADGCGAVTCQGDVCHASDKPEHASSPLHNAVGAGAEEG
eukprot:scaffold174284_cov21-Tisochrysis_lutea.AAC.3